MVEELERRQNSLADFSAWMWDFVYMKDSDGTLLPVRANFVSANGFHLLGAKPSVGRLFDADDHPAGSSDAWPIVLSYACWKSRYNSDPDILGKTVVISDVALTVVGVLPSDFPDIRAGVDASFYMPVSVLPLMRGKNWNQIQRFVPFGRLKPGVTLQQADAEMQTLGRPIFEATLSRRILQLDVTQRSSLRIKSGRRGWTYLVDNASRPLFLLEGLVAVVLILCCLNISGLLMARNYSRAHEFATRAALGASQSILIRQCLTEGLVLALLGSVVGAILAWSGSGVLMRFFNPIQLLGNLIIRPDESLFIATVLLVIITAVGIALIPAILAGRTPPALLLNTRSGVGNPKQHLARVFVPLQIGLSLALTIISGLLAHSLHRILSEPPGFRTQGIMSTKTNFARLPKESLLALYEQMEVQLQTMPGIQSVAIALHAPLDEPAIGSFAGGTEHGVTHQDPAMFYTDVTARYFRTLNIQVLDGREFLPSEHDRSTCILNRVAANFLFPYARAVGQYVRSFKTDQGGDAGNLTCRVVGIVENVKLADFKVPPPRIIYFPLSEVTIAYSTDLNFLIQAVSSGDAIAGYRRVLVQNAPTTPLLAFQSLSEKVERSIGPDRLVSALSLSFAALALLLSAVALYGLETSIVTKRRGELAVRIALGAQRWKVIRMILFEALRIIIAGVVLGIFGSWIGARLFRTFLYKAPSIDVPVLLGSIALLAAIEFVASAIPAWHAASVDPLEALRTE
jgi:predicted permease